MAEIAKIQVTADADMGEGERRRLATIASADDQHKQFELLADVERNATDIKVAIDKVSGFETKSNTTKKKGEKTSLLGLLPPYDYSMRHLVAQGNIKKGEILNIKIETS